MFEKFCFIFVCITQSKVLKKHDFGSDTETLALVLNDTQPCKCIPTHSHTGSHFLIFKITKCLVLYESITGHCILLQQSE